MTSPFPSGQTKLGVGEASVEISPWFREQFKACMNDPLFNVSDTLFPPWMLDTISRLGLSIPIGQVVGFSGFTGDYAAIATQQNTSSATYTDLATTGPTLSGIADGTYLVMVGAVAKDAGGNGAFIAPSVNAATPQNIHGGETQTTVFASIIGVSSQTLSNGNNNTIKAQYRSNAGTVCTFLNRWIFALKLANA